MNRHQETTANLTTLLHWAKRGRGWAFREYPPQFKHLAGGCELIVLVPTLWRPRVGPRPRPVCAPIDLAQERARRVLLGARVADKAKLGRAVSAQVVDLFEGLQA